MDAPFFATGFIVAITGGIAITRITLVDAGENIVFFLISEEI